MRRGFVESIRGHSIVLVVLATTYSFIVSIGEVNNFLIGLKIILLIPLFLLTWTILSLLKILYVYWDGPDDFLDMKKAIENLYIIRNKRSVIVRLSVIRSGISLVIIVLTLALYLFIG